MAKSVGEILLRDRVLSAIQLQDAIQSSKSQGGRLEQVLLQKGLVNEGALSKAVAEHYGVKYIDDLSKLEIPKEVVALIPKDMAQKFTILPLSRQGPTIAVAMGDPGSLPAIDAIKFKTQCTNVAAYVAPESQIKTAIERYYSTDAIGSLATELAESADMQLEVEDEPSVEDSAKAATDAPVVKLVNAVLTEAIKRKASDIHIEPFEDEFRVRYRVDGSLYEVMKQPPKLKDAVISRIKIMSKLDISERRLPQDGRIKIKLDKDRSMEYRVSILPTLFGEKACLRLLDKNNLQFDMTKLGFEEAQLKSFKEGIEAPYGMVLVTGPTGSGKTNTLYSALQELNQIADNICTAEDPVEFTLKGIIQVQMQEDIGLTFAAALRSFLRQDPDIIMVGEIRDFETAEIAIKAALTGHLVLSTLHTNDAPSTITRLMNMGIEPFLVSSSLNAVVAQRLARKVCKDCKGVANVPKQALIELGMTPEEANATTCTVGKGCSTCNGSGCKGRIGIMEVLTVSDEIKQLILENAPVGQLKAKAIEQGMISLRRNGLNKLKSGMISYEEVLRTSMRD